MTFGVLSRNRFNNFKIIFQSFGGKSLSNFFLIGHFLRPSSHLSLLGVTWILMSFKQIWTVCRGRLEARKDKTTSQENHRRHFKPFCPSRGYPSNYTYYIRAWQRVIWAAAVLIHYGYYLGILSRFSLMLLLGNGSIKFAQDTQLWPAKNSFPFLNTYVRPWKQCDQIRLDNFLKFRVKIFLTKVAQMYSDFWASLKTSLLR